MAKEIFAQLFLDTGNGFNEDDSIRIPLNFGHVDVEFEISEYGSIEKLRLDPTNFPSIVSDLKITYKSEDSETKPDYYLTSEGITEDNLFLFFHHDPNFSLAWDSNSKVDKVCISFYLPDSVDLLTDYREAIVSNVEESLEFKLNKLENILKKINSKVSGFSGELGYQQSLLTKISQTTKALPDLEKLETNFTSIFSGSELLSKLDQFTEIKSRLSATEEKLKIKNTQLDDQNKLIHELQTKLRNTEALLNSDEYKEGIANREEVVKLEKENKKLISRQDALAKKQSRYLQDKARWEAKLEAKSEEMESHISRMRAEVNMMSEENKSLHIRIEQLNKHKEEYEKMMSELEYLIREI